MSQTHSDRWLSLACAALSRPGENSVSHAAGLADDMLREYEARFGDTAVLIAGIFNCSVCDKEIGDKQFLVRRGEDGMYRKFCKPCVEEHTNPGIAPKEECPIHTVRAVGCEHCDDEVSEGLNQTTP